MSQVYVNSEVGLVFNDLFTEAALHKLRRLMRTFKVNVSVAPAPEQRIADHATTRPVIKRR